MSTTRSPAEVCAIFDSSKSTLFRWEAEGYIPAPSRNTSGYREYTEQDIQIIGRVVQARRHRHLYAQNLAQDKINARIELERLGEQNVLSRLANLGDMTGLAELREYRPLHACTIQHLLEIAVQEHGVGTPLFWEILEVINETSRPVRPGEGP